MNLDPKSSKNYAKAIEKNKKMNQGARHEVDGVMMTQKQIAEILGVKVNTVWRNLQKEAKAQNYVNRIRRRSK